MKKTTPLLLITLLLGSMAAMAQEPPAAPKVDREAADTAGCDCARFKLDDVTDLGSDELPCWSRCMVRRIGRTPWHPGIDFAWGFHNWGPDRLAGLGGADGPAAVRTSFNHLLLTMDCPVVHSRRVALFVGVGLEWDRYKFHKGDIVFDEVTSPHGVAVGSGGAEESHLLTRHVVLPVAVRFDLGHHWQLEVAALPGFHWSGSHTGLRREYRAGQDETLVKDYAVNPYINPYKLDARLRVSYRGVGLYFQAAMLPAFKGSCEELFPVKFGVIL